MMRGAIESGCCLLMMDIRPNGILDKLVFLAQEKEWQHKVETVPVPNHAKL
jgi:hypothetical protein